MEMEIHFLMDFKIDPFELGDMTVMDFQSYFDVFMARYEERRKNLDSGKVTKMLAVMRDMLNTMSLPEY